ncbi:MAG: DUF2619 domain-containing protein [Firmicutes bacterium]|nr:DUF2619 domain-containing protein [Bacillota bacterium]
MSFEPVVWKMFGLRTITATVSLLASLAMLHFNQVDKAVAINNYIAVLNTVAFAVVGGLGVAALLAAYPPYKIAMVVIGILLTYFGTKA